jgi:hypothetical protein
MGAPKQNKNAVGNSGRPSGYLPEYAEQAEKLCRLGATDFHLADFFGVASSTIHRWRGEYEEFAAATRIGKGVPDDRVERGLYERAVGYSYESEKVFQYQGEAVRVRVTEHVPPDPGAAINWLKNRRPGEWRDKTEIEMSITDGLAERLARARARREAQQREEMEHGAEQGKASRDVTREERDADDDAS